MINLVLQNGVRKSPDLPDVPLAMDFITGETDHRTAALYFGLKRVARPILCGPQVPADRLQALRDAFAQLKDDADYKADAQKLGLADPTPARDVEDRQARRVRST